MAAAAQLVRRHHDALAGTPLAAGRETVCHNDLGPCNAVHRDGLPVAFIDWDTAAPGPRIDDLAHAVWRWAVVSDTDELPLAEQVRRIRLMCDAYGQRDRVAVLDAIRENMDRVIAESSRRGDLGSVEWHSGEHAWFQRHRREFEHGLRVQ
jgi:aminoglycoside phosphotransferase (APT) family kinase protein